MHLLIKSIIASLLIASLIAVSQSAEDSSPKQVLILASYNLGMKWDDSIISEIKHQFAIHMPSAAIDVEFMDTKRIDPNASRLNDLKALYLKKYKDHHFDVIISIDTDAFNFLLANRDEIFPGTPVVFCGVVNFEDEMIRERPNFTGVTEVFDINETISLMLNLHPDTKLIAVVNDNTTTGRANRKIMDDAIAGFKDRVSFEYLDNLTEDQLAERVSALPDDSLILEMTFNRDKDGKILTYEDTTSLLHSYSSVPIYALWDFFIGYGIVGGKLLTGSSQGSEAAKLALRILEGEDADSIPVLRKNFNRFKFDDFELARFGIPITSLPPDSIIVNQPFQPRIDLSGNNLSRLNLSQTKMTRSQLQNTNMDMHVSSVKPTIPQ
jgi:ABC-type uncharacterized transport system substrate-binding protein